MIELYYFTENMIMPYKLYDGNCIYHYLDKWSKFDLEVRQAKWLKDYKHIKIMELI